MALLGWTDPAMSRRYNAKKVAIEGATTVGANLAIIDLFASEL